jgi:hypothetical protein
VRAELLPLLLLLDCLQFESVVLHMLDVIVDHGSTAARSIYC